MGGVVLRAGTPSKAGGQQSSADATLPLQPLPLSSGCGLGQKEQFNFSLELQHYLKQYLEKADVIA